VTTHPTSKTNAIEDNAFLIFSSIDILLRLLTIHHFAGSLARCPDNILVALLLTLSNLLLLPWLSAQAEIADHVFDVLAIITDSLTDEVRSQCIRVLRDRNQTKDSRLHFVFGHCEKSECGWLQSLLTSSHQLGSKGEETQQTPRAKFPYPLRRWEMVQEATPLVAENDTSISLALFGAREVVF
jgi:hypothetical protein